MTMTDEDFEDLDEGDEIPDGEYEDREDDADDFASMICPQCGGDRTGEMPDGAPFCYDCQEPFPGF